MQMYVQSADSNLDNKLLPASPPVSAERLGDDYLARVGKDHCGYRAFGDYVEGSAFDHEPGTRFPTT